MPFICFPKAWTLGQAGQTVVCGCVARCGVATKDPCRSFDEHEPALGLSVEQIGGVKTALA